MTDRDDRRNDRSFRKEEFPCAEHGEALAKLAITMQDFIQHSIDDRKECTDRYVRDRQEQLEYRKAMLDRMERLELFIEGLKPDHKLLMRLAVLIILGALSLVWRLVWTNLKIGGG